MAVNHFKTTVVLINVVKTPQHEYKNDVKVSEWLVFFVLSCLNKPTIENGVE